MIYLFIKHLLICISISVSFKAEALAEPLNAKVTGLYMQHSRGERDVCAGGGWLKAERLMEIQLPGTRTWDVTDHKMIQENNQKTLLELLAENLCACFGTTVYMTHEGICFVSCPPLFSFSRQASILSNFPA